MRSQPLSWTRLLKRLGFVRKKRRSRAQTGYHRNLRFEQCEDRHLLATFTVNHPGDFFDSNPNVTTLREAIFAAQQLPDLDTINFAASGIIGGSSGTSNGNDVGETGVE